MLLSDLQAAEFFLVDKAMDGTLCKRTFSRPGKDFRWFPRRMTGASL